MVSSWSLQNIDLFELLCPHKYEAFNKHHQSYTFEKGQSIYTQNNNASKVYLVQKGKVKIGFYTSTGREVVKFILSKGELFGESAVLNYPNRNEYAVAITDDTILCSVTIKQIRTLMIEHKNFSLAIYKRLGSKFTKLERRLELLMFRNVRTRILEFLNDLATEIGYQCQHTGDIVIEHEYTQKDIAALLAMSRPTLNKELSNLKSENLINFSRKEFRIRKILNKEPIKLIRKEKYTVR
ncbi:MAG: Crp/Fnr family transcriptional regulator [Bacteroidota bacterium]